MPWLYVYNASERFDATAGKILRLGLVGSPANSPGSARSLLEVDGSEEGNNDAEEEDHGDGYDDEEEEDKESRRGGSPRMTQKLDCEPNAELLREHLPLLRRFIRIVSADLSDFSFRCHLASLPIYHRQLSAQEHRRSRMLGATRSDESTVAAASNLVAEAMGEDGEDGGSRELLTRCSVAQSTCSNGGIMFNISNKSTTTQRLVSKTVWITALRTGHCSACDIIEM